jgi:hypothetical protein
MSKVMEGPAWNGAKPEGSRGGTPRCKRKTGMTCHCIKHNPWQAGDTSASPKQGHLGQRCRKEGKPLAHTHPEHFSNFDTQRENNVPPKAPLSFPKSPLRAPQVCGGSQPGRLRASAGRNPSGRPRPGQGGSEGKGRAKVKGRRGRDRKQKRKDRGEQGQHVKSYGRPCMKWGKTRGQQGGAPPDAKGKLG